MKNLTFEDRKMLEKLLKQKIVVTLLLEGTITSIQVPRQIITEEG